MTTSNDSSARFHYWQQQVEAWQDSALSQTEFCKRHHLVHHRFVHWKLKLAGASRRSPPAPAAAASGFAVVHPVIRENAGESSLMLTLPNGVRVSGVTAANLAVVQQLLEPWR